MIRAIFLLSAVGLAACSSPEGIGFDTYGLAPQKSPAISEDEAYAKVRAERGLPPVSN
ncbi:MAG: hypothetical protein AAGA05_03450 [Pseudomonadota bacterium]